MRWRYAGKTERGAGVDSLLVLEKIGDGERIAQLVRGEGIRTAGTKARDAGNGGRLEIAEDEEEGEGKMEEREVMVVVTVLVMLKKEIDRLRGVQVAVLSGAV